MKVMIIQKQSEMIKYSTGEATIKQCKQFKYLWILFNKTLSCKEHTEYIKTVISNKTIGIRQKKAD